jgi:hypothetical protein
MGCAQEVLETFKRIRWRSAREVTPEAETLIRDHITKMRLALKHLGETRQLSPTEAYAEAQSAGSQAAGYKAFMDRLFHDVEFQGAGVREPLILSAASYCFWSEDPELGKLENPWAPLLKLYEAGYTSSFEEDEQQKTLTLLIGHKGGVKPYPLVD